MFLAQLEAYSVWLWALWIVGTYFAARKGGWQGVLTAHFLIAFMVLVSDLAWIQSETQRPDYPGTPDADMIFHFGCFLRVILVNSVLLPVAIVGLFLRARRQQRQMLDPI